MAFTLESRYADRIAEFEAQREQALPEHRRRLEDAQRRLAAHPHDAALRERVRVEDEEVRRLERAEIEYLLDSAPFIKEYSSTQAVEEGHIGGALSAFVEVTHKSNKNNVLQRYLMQVEKQVDYTTMAAITAHGDSTSRRNPKEAEYFCGTCDVGMTYHPRESMLVCEQCGACKAFTEMNASNMTYEQETHQDVVTYFAYKRLNHFCEWLNSLQAKVRLNRNWFSFLWVCKTTWHSRPALGWRSCLRWLPLAAWWPRWSR